MDQLPAATLSQRRAPAPPHAYYATRDPDSERETFTAITAMPAYAELSMEELRYAQQHATNSCTGTSFCMERLRLSDADTLTHDTVYCTYSTTLCRDYCDYGRVLHSVSAQQDSVHLSFEELRYLGTVNETDPDTPTITYATSTRTTATILHASVASWGPTLPRFTPTLLESETSTNWPFAQSITAMDAFATKSFEELRLEDRNAPIEWRRLVAASQKLPLLSLMELRVRDSVRQVMDASSDWWTHFKDSAHAELVRAQWIEPLITQWTAVTIQETIARWYSAFISDRFRSYMNAYVEKARVDESVLRTVPAALGWVAQGSSVREPLLPLPRSLAGVGEAKDAFAFLGFYCAQARLVRRLRQRDDGFHWSSRQTQAEILDGVGDIAAALVSRLVDVTTLGDLNVVTSTRRETNAANTRTSVVVTETLHVEETRPDMLRALRDNARRVQDYVASCQQLVLDVLQLRGNEARHLHATRTDVVLPSHIDSVVVSDTHNSATMDVAVCDEIKRLHLERLWDAKSSQVRDLVDPFLDTDAADRTRRIPCFTSLDHARPLLDPYTRMSEIAFQNTVPANAADTLWLPSDVVVQSDGRAVFASYIYNLHPKLCRGLYTQLERGLTHMIPSFEQVVWSLKLSRPCTPWFDINSTDGRDGLGRRPVPITNLAHFDASCRPSLWSLKDSHVQVVVRMQEIHVSVSQPFYTAGEWDVRGLANEDIAAVGLYCFGAVNIAAASMGFMCIANNELNGVYTRTGITAVYGESESTPHFGLWPWRRLGNVSIREGKSITWPSSYRARLEDVKWSDATGNGEPGLLKLVWYYLVSPGSPVLSTSDVPPHQPRWSTTAINALAHAFQLPDIVVELILAFSHAHYSD